MVNLRFPSLCVLAPAALLASAPLQAVDEGVLIGRMTDSSALADLRQQQEALNALKMQQGMPGDQDKNAKRDIKKREMEVKRAIVKEQARIKDVARSCKELFAKGGKKNVLSATDKQGRTLIMLVATLGRDDITRLVLDDNPDLTATDAEGRTALDYENEAGGSAIRGVLDERWAAAIKKGDASAAEELLDCGVNASDPVQGEDEPPLAIAIRKQHGDLLFLLANSNPSISGRSKEGFTLLELAARMGNAEAIPVLLGIGADDGSRFSNGVTPLCYMATFANADCFDAYMRTTQLLPKETLASYVTRVGSVEKIRMVVKDAATANREDPEGNIPILEAARRGKPEVFNLLLELGGSRTATNSRGETTLMHAALSGNEEVLEEAMKGLDDKELNRKDKKGANAADYAKRSRSTAVCDLMKAAGLKPTNVK